MSKKKKNSWAFSRTLFGKKKSARKRNLNFFPESPRLKNPVLGKISRKSQFESYLEIYFLGSEKLDCILEGGLTPRIASKSGLFWSCFEQCASNIRDNSNRTEDSWRAVDDLKACQIPGFQELTLIFGSPHKCFFLFILIQKQTKVYIFGLN